MDSPELVQFFCETLEGKLSYRCCLGRQTDELFPCSPGCPRGKENRKKFQGIKTGKSRKGWRNRRGPGAKEETEEEMEEEPTEKKRRGSFKGKSPYSPRFGYEYPRKS